MTKVNNQDPCGACTAFGSISALEAFINLYFNYHVDMEEVLHLSERDAFNCSKFGEGTTNVGCICEPDWGKPLISVLNYITNNGIVDEDCFPWISPWCVGSIPDCSPAYSGKCEENEIRVTIEPGGKIVYYKNPINPILLITQQPRIVLKLLY
jgi:hypothetical protein